MNTISGDSNGRFAFNNNSSACDGYEAKTFDNRSRIENKENIYPNQM